MSMPRPHLRSTYTPKKSQGDDRVLTIRHLYFFWVRGYRPLFRRIERRMKYLLSLPVDLSDYNSFHNYSIIIYSFLFHHGHFALWFPYQQGRAMGTGLVQGLLLAGMLGEEALAGG